MSTSTQKLILLMLVQMTTAQQCSGGHNPSSNPKAITAIPDKIDEKSEENAKHLEHVPVAHSTESKPVEPSAPPAPSPSIEIEESKAQLDEPIKQKPKTKAYTKEEEDDENEEEDEKEGKGKKPGFFQMPIKKFQSPIKVQSIFTKRFKPRMHLFDDKDKEDEKDKKNKKKNKKK